ncbi:MAG TPA: flagellar hook-length control protein FliK [Pseudolabrys sp.]|nr:flagellar hook-length control protein FliK [Pseudolabrys sp.]
MPQVASDPKVHAPNLHMPRVTRPAPSDHAPSPFESLIEDTSPPAEPAPPQHESRVARSDDKQAPAKSKESKATEPNDDTKPAYTDEAVKAEEAPADESTAKVDGKKVANPEEVANVADSIQTKPNLEPDAGPKTGDASVTTPADGVVTVANSNATSIVPAPAQTPSPTPDDGKQVEQPLQQLALVADATPKMKRLGADVPKAAAGKKVEDGKAKQADAGDQVETDQPAAETDDAFQILTKDATPQHAEGKPQAGMGDGEKHHVSQGRGDFITPSHRSDTGAPTPPGAEVNATARTLNDIPTQLPIPSSAPHASENAAAPATLVSQPGPQPAAVPLSGVAIEIAGKALAGKNRFEIRLDPPELGRIDVRLDVDRDGNVTSRLTVDRPDTLDLLRRDAAGLERALQDAGLKTANNGLQFSLRDQSMNEQQAGTSPDAAVLVATDESLPSSDVIPQQYRLAGQGGGLDIRV